MFTVIPGFKLFAIGLQCPLLNAQCNVCKFIQYIFNECVALTQNYSIVKCKYGTELLYVSYIFA